MTVQVVDAVTGVPGVSSLNSTILSFVLPVWSQSMERTSWTSVVMSFCPAPDTVPSPFTVYVVA